MGFASSWGGGVLELLEKTTLGDGHTNGRSTDGFTRGASVNNPTEETTRLTEGDTRTKMGAEGKRELQREDAASLASVFVGFNSVEAVDQGGPSCGRVEMGSTNRSQLRLIVDRGSEVGNQ